ncbi:SIS domain-containing protein [Tabrizicola sp.]|uniref:SIS domain-containing protein n=1 Tax=Tabrizicola sp. TaxID=2005166 RepID=UPI0027366974|nr:SIS domain-containing protein [Tabrizicola sp.]MDP3197867.1 SIS domain-containing protein [Tabrizicola sp.]MDZ4068396.1 SIS domain-containing protein [Tabrizicola sp.]
MTDLSRHATFREILAQPAIWRDWGARLQVADLRQWIAETGVSEVWFCGAGTSAYIGDILASGLEGQPGPRFRSVPTTDIVARPRAYLTGQPKLIVSFGRSGSSTESIGLLDALDTLAPAWPRLNITCNARSALATRPGSHVITLPEATHDQGFAMTSSFSTMLLTAAALFDASLPASQMPSRFAFLADTLQTLLPDFISQATATRRPARAVFIGSGPLAFAAREAALKVMELAAGQIPALWDSTLGFRHGPKSFTVGDTDLWLFRSSDPHTRAYDEDLLAELRTQFPQSRITAPDIPQPHGDLWSVPLYVSLAQILAVIWSDGLGLNVDDPFAGQGTLTRVVSGVRLHPVHP